MREAEWHGCYDDSWKGLIGDEAFAHPAKMARGLLCRIFEHLNLPKGSVVVDPFAGVGTTGIEAASRGLRAYLCELEPRFVELAKANFELHRRIWEQFRNPQPVIVQGDSRRLCAVLGPVLADCVVSSPPYSETALSGGVPKTGQGLTQGQRCIDDYGSTPGQLGNMKPGDVDAVVSSPPYAESIGNENQIDYSKAKGKHDGLKPSTARTALGGPYGQTPGQLGAMKPGDVDAVVSSPPFQDARSETTRPKPPKSMDGHLADKDGRLHRLGACECGDDPANIANLPGDTFWEAARQIVSQCHTILKPTGIAIWVLKDFVRNKQRVPFSDDWRKLCEACGFTTVEWIHASLVKEDRHPGLFGEEIVKTVSRKSFFRRLAESKGSPPIDWEDVIICHP